MNRKLRVRYHSIADSDVFDEEYTGELRVDVLSGIESALRRAVATDHGERRHLAALNRIVAIIETGGQV